MKQQAFFSKGLLILLPFLIFQSIQSQNLRFGINGNIGANEMVFRPDIFEQESFTTFSSSLGITLEDKLSKRLSLIYEAHLIQMGERFLNENVQIEQVINETFFRGAINTNGESSVIYLGISVLFQYRIGKIGLSAGVQPMSSIFGFGRIEMNGELNGEIVEFSERTAGLIVRSSLNLGPKFRLNYAISDKLSVRADYYHGLYDSRGGPIRGRNTIIISRLNHQITLGVNYYI